MLFFSIIKVILIIFVVLFILTLFIYFFNLDMKFASLLIRPLTWWYDYSAEVRKRKEEKKKK